MNDKIQIEQAEEKDLPLLVELISELAKYENLTHEVVVTETLLRESLFGKDHVAYALTAYYDGEPAAMAIYFFNFSTFLGRPGLYLEDLFVRPHFREKGIGKALFARLKEIAEENKCGRFEWSVLDWNQPAIEFYKKQGAKPLDEWTVFRITLSNHDV